MVYNSAMWTFIFSLVAHPHVYFGDLDCVFPLSLLAQIMQIMARLIFLVTLILKSVGKILWCYHSYQWNPFGRIFAWCHLFCGISQKDILEFWSKFSLATTRSKKLQLHYNFINFVGEWYCTWGWSWNN